MASIHGKLAIVVTYKHPHAAEREHVENQKTGDKKGPIIGFSIGLLLFIACAIPARSHALTGFQADIYHAVNNIDLPSAFTQSAKYATEALGAAYAIAGCVLVALLFKKYRLSWRFLFTAAGTVAVFYVVKKIINEPRPIAMLHGNLHQRVVETGPGFPSGHVAAATSLALTLWYALPKNWRWIPILWILIVAWSRLYLGVHTPADVIGGFAVGLMAVCFVRLLPESITRPLRLDD